MEDTVHGLSRWITGLNPVLAVALVSALPWIELRGGIPVGIALLGLPAWKTIAAALVGNSLAVTPIVLGTKLYEKRLERVRWLRWLLNWSLSRARRHEQVVNRYGSIGLALLVAIPVPGTGAWTATAVSILVGMRLGPTLAAIYGGLVICAAVVYAATAGVIGGASLIIPPK
ncbi:MAG: small multi-drug export protein [Armatimonadota bacterium]|nr:MAG: small multi-drug export protein [Armatimonadota bacterium]